MKWGFYFISILSILQGILGLIGIEVWIRNRGWILLSLNESLFYIAIGIIAFFLSKKYL